MKHGVPKGYLIHGMVKIAITIPPDMFDELRRISWLEGKSFSTVVIDRVRAGQMCLDESDALEPQN